ncbi:sigma factor-like helix-turn-helix DNA-binding protein [Streptomyces sp. NPDC052727]|uniref:RNA polymerase sigma factor n=1 Tax=Streptomyces sp. NPDC052727 TaxID=3154854 RepID=UPI00343B20D2
MFRRHSGALAGPGDPEAYGGGAWSTARAVLRRRRRARAPRTGGPAPTYRSGPFPSHRRNGDVLPKEEHREVQEALRSLTRRQREALVLRYWSYVSEAQIAETLGLSRGTAMSTAGGRWPRRPGSWKRDVERPDPLPRTRTDWKTCCGRCSPHVPAPSVPGTCDRCSRRHRTTSRGGRGCGGPCRGRWAWRPWW